MELIPDLEYDMTQAKTDAQEAEILAKFFSEQCPNLATGDSGCPLPLPDNHPTSEFPASANKQY